MKPRPEPSAAVYAVGATMFVVAAIAGGLTGQWVVLAASVVATVWLAVMAFAKRRAGE